MNLETAYQNGVDKAVQRLKNKIDQAVLNQKYFDYLVKLRDSGETNMWGAPPYLVREFGITHKEANAIFCAWVESFEK